MKLPKNRLDGLKWLIEEKKVQLVKLRQQRKEPVGSEKAWASRTKKRSFKDMKFNRNHNAGVLTGRISGILVLDIDDSTLFPKEYRIPDTFTVKTSKGYHHYYELPEDGKSYKNRAKKDLGFDIRGEGGYVVAPWSTHPDGTQYNITEDAEFAPAPKWLLDLAEEGTSGKATKGALKAPTLINISKPKGFVFPPVNKTLIEDPTKRGERSEKIWQVLNELVAARSSDEDILYIFESNPKGIGSKYFEKGAGRTTWLTGQVDKIRKTIADRYADLVVAKDQASADHLVKEIISFISSGTSVSIYQEQSIREFVNLLIALYEGSETGWYAIPIPVGGGKTVTILHFIKFLYTYDKKRTFPVSVAFEKIEEIERAAKWLKDQGVSDDFYQVVHHKVEDVAKVLKELPKYPVVLHTHQKLSGSSYVEDYFKYGGEIRKLLVFDESMLNAMVHSKTCRLISSMLSTLIREHGVNGDFQRDIPKEICRFFEKLNDQIEVEEKKLNAGTKREVTFEPDTKDLDGFTYGELVRYSRIIESKLGDDDLYRDILLASCAPKELRKMSLVRGQGKPAVFVTKELLDEDIVNLVTTDASREFRRLFKYTQRSDGKKVRIYRTVNFRHDDEVGVFSIPLRSGRESLRKAFDDPKSNPYLDEIAKIVEKHERIYAKESAMGPPKPSKAKYLFFYPKGIETIPDRVELRLLKDRLIPLNEADDRLRFETFGRETATDAYKDCGVIVFIGLNHKPQHTINALLAGEGFTGDPDAVRKEVETGEFLQQLQQGMGRGTLRKGQRQFVYFFDMDPERFKRDIHAAFPMCYFDGRQPEWFEEAEANDPQPATYDPKDTIDPGW
ncbi:bifunctional DNA primase/polymerase [Crocinitomicaceae bacterium]|nr:bifunctional DNA primase/polymerase [Crocinitomicaceae bacterium]